MTDNTALQMCINWARSSTNNFRVEQSELAAAELAALRSQVAEAQAERDRMRGLVQRFVNRAPKQIAPVIHSDGTHDDSYYDLVSEATRALEARTDARGTGDAAECPICHAVDYCVHRDN